MSSPTFTTPADEDFFATIGRFTITWAILEFWIDQAIFILHYNLNGREIESEIPWSLKRKLKYVTRCFNELSKRGKGFRLLAPSVKTLMKEVESSSVFRHDLLHGITLDHAEGASTVKMARLLRGRKPHEHKKFEVTTMQIMDEAVAAMKLANRSRTLAEGLRKLIEMASKK